MSNYKSFVRPFHLEEPLDYIFFRPIAYITIKGLQKIPLTPNLFSIIALAFAWSADLAIISGQIPLIQLAGFAILIFSVLDCCDGMWARWKGNPYPYGDLIDMFVDLLAAVGHVAALIYLSRTREQSFLLPLLSGVMMFVHASFFHDRKSLWRALAHDEPDERSATVRKYRAELGLLRHKNEKVFSSFLIRSFLLFSSLQAAERALPKMNEKKLSKLKQALPWWGWAAGTTHLSIMAISLILNQPNYYYFFALFVANIFTLIAWVIERD